MREPVAADTPAEIPRGPGDTAPHSAHQAGAAPGAVWAKHAVRLARWTQATLVNRTDRYGVYRCVPGKRADVYEAKTTLTSDALAEHFSTARRVGLHAISANETSRWVVIDVDRHDEKVDRDKNTAAALAWCTKAKLLGYTPLLEDSDGRGSFKLWILFESPVPTAKARAFGLSLTRDWSEQGLPARPEVFPKQSRLSGKMSGGWVRLPGRHHTRDHWSRFWSGDRWLDGEEAVNLLAAAVGGPPPATDASDRRPASEKADRVDDQAGIPIEILRTALAALPAEFRDEYGHWIRVGMCLHELGDLGFELWEAWSQPSVKFQEGECRRKWETFSPDGVLRVRHLLECAEEHGWRGSAEPTDESPGDADDGGGAEEPDEGQEADTGPVPIAWASKPFERIIAAVYRAARRTEPEVFQHGDALVRLRLRRHDGARVIESLSQDAIRGWLDRIVRWLVRTKDGFVRTPPPVMAVRELMSLPGWDPSAIPVLERVTEVPVFTRDGVLVDQPGLHRASGLYYSPPKGFVVPPVSEPPSPSDVAEAKRLLLDEFLGDFPFKDDRGASRAHTLSGILVPFVREMIDGPVPLHEIDASKPGSGKGLLTDAIVYPSTGRPAETTPYPGNEEEMRKAITAALMEGPPYISFDNVKDEIDSAALANFLTSPLWSDRILGVSKKAHLPVKVLTLANGNNLRLSTEMTRRVVLIRLEPTTERPWERPASGFRHNPLLEWAARERGRLVWAILVLVKYWLAGGRKSGTQTLGRFEGWARVIGGILDAAGVPGLMANSTEMYAWADEGTDEWRMFVLTWWAEAGTNAVGAKNLFPLVRDGNLLPSVLGYEEEEEKLKKKFGKALSKQTGAVYSGLRIKKEAGKNKRDGTLIYSLEPIDPAQHPAGPAVASSPPHGRDGIPMNGWTQADTDRLLGAEPEPTLPPAPPADTAGWYDLDAADGDKSNDEPEMDA